MIITASVIVLIGMGWAATALFGTWRATRGFVAQAALAVPFMAVCAAVGLHYGMGLLGALIAALGVLGALLLPTVLPAPRTGGSDEAGRAAVTWASSTVVLVCLGGLLLSWTASMIQFASPLNRTAVVITLGISALLAGIGRGATVAWSRVFAFGSIVVALLLVVAAVAVGAPSTVASPAVTTNSDGIVPGILFAVALAIIGASHPGLRSAVARDRGGVVLAGVIMSVVAGIALVAMLALCGGWITQASFPMFVILAFMPPSILTLVVAVVALLGIAGLRRIFQESIALDVPIQDLVFTRTGAHRDTSRWIVTALVTVLIIGLAVLPISPILLVGVATAFAVIALVANRTLAAGSDPAGGPDLTTAEPASAPSTGRP